MRRYGAFGVFLAHTADDDEAARSRVGRLRRSEVRQREERQRGERPPMLLGLLGRIAAVARGAGSRRSHEQCLAVGERDVAAVRPHRAIFRLEPVDLDHRADLDLVARDAAALQRIRRAAFDRPLSVFPSGVFTSM